MKIAGGPPRVHVYIRHGSMCVVRACVREHISRASQPTGDESPSPSARPADDRHDTSTAALCVFYVYIYIMRVYFGTGRGAYGQNGKTDGWGCGGKQKKIPYKRRQSFSEREVVERTRQILAAADRNVSCSSYIIIYTREATRRRSDAAVYFSRSRDMETYATDDDDERRYVEFGCDVSSYFLSLYIINSMTLNIILCHNILSSYVCMYECVCMYPISNNTIKKTQFFFSTERLRNSLN